MTNTPDRRALLLAFAALGGCTPLETFNTLARTDKGGALVAQGASYGPDPRQAVDVYRPERPGIAPVLVYFYGGNWNSGSRRDYAFIGKTFAARGFVTVLADYRLMPGHPFPAFIEDGAAAVRFARTRAAEWGGDAGQLFLAGHSAGAYIAVMLGAEGRWLGAVGENRSSIRGIAGIAGPYDFYPFTNRITAATFGNAADPRRTQPAHVAEAGAPPMLLLQGGADSTVLPHNSGAMAARLRAVGSAVEERMYPGVGHVEIMTALTPNFRKAAPTLVDILNFFTRKGARPV